MQTSVTGSRRFASHATTPAAPLLHAVIRSWLSIGRQHLSVGDSASSETLGDGRNARNSPAGRSTGRRPIRSSHTITPRRSSRTRRDLRKRNGSCAGRSVNGRTLRPGITSSGTCSGKSGGFRRRLTCTASRHRWRTAMNSSPKPISGPPGPWTRPRRRCASSRFDTSGRAERCLARRGPVHALSRHDEMESAFAAANVLVGSESGGSGRGIHQRSVSAALRGEMRSNSNDPTTGLRLWNRRPLAGRPSWLRSAARQASCRPVSARWWGIARRNPWRPTFTATCRVPWRTSRSIRGRRLDASDVRPVSFTTAQQLQIDWLRRTGLRRRHLAER